MIGLAVFSPLSSHFSHHHLLHINEKIVTACFFVCNYQFHGYVLH